MTEKSELLPSSAVETAPAPAISALPVAPSPGVVERCLERVEDDDLKSIRFSDACKALDFASRLARHARETPAADTPDQGLRDELADLLDQACGETLKPS